MELKQERSTLNKKTTVSLLIVPYGIETYITPQIAVIGNPFNCTLWN